MGGVGTFKIIDHFTLYFEDFAFPFAAFSNDGPCFPSISERG